MTACQVWAPAARTVELYTPEGKVAMRPQERGRWRADSPLPGGTDYAFILDGGDPLPDPRSPWQPYGVHGLSRTVDHSSFAWTDSSWRPPPLPSAVIYELHVGTFTPAGRFESVVEQLDHLVDLGVTHVEIMPVNEFPGRRGWGYDGVALYAPHHAYGGPLGLKRLIDACHAKGLAAILDVVYNHFGPSGNYLSRYGPYLTDQYQTPWGNAVNLDAAGSDEVRRFLCDNALMWLRDYHFDALRIDAVHAFYDRSAVHFLEQLAGEVGELEIALKRSVALIAESDLNDPRVIRPVEVGGYGIDAQWNDDFHHAIHTLLTGENSGYYADFGAIRDLEQALTRGFVYAGRYSAFRERSHGRPADGLPGRRFIGYLQSHDQVGNRAKGERSSHLMSPARLKVGAALVFAAPFIPMLFQGEEWGASTPFLYLTHHDDPATARAATEGRRREFAAFGWNPTEIPDPQAESTFFQSKLRWSEIDREPHKSLLAWHRELTRLRRTVSSLSSGRMDRVRVSYEERSRWIAVEREDIVTVCNLGSEPHELHVSDLGAKHVLLASPADIEGEAAGRLRLPPDSVVILGVEAAAAAVRRSREGCHE